MSFGRSLHIDYIIEEIDSLQNMEYIRKMFTEIIGAIGMKFHTFEGIPFMVSDLYAGENRPDTMGCSITALLSTSNASIHTTKNGIYLDIFSCNPILLNTDNVYNIIKKYFKIEGIRNQYMFTR